MLLNVINISISSLSPHPRSRARTAHRTHAGQKMTAQVCHRAQPTLGLAAVLRTQRPRPQRQAVLVRHTCCQQGLPLRTLCWLGRSFWGTAAQSGSFPTQSPFLPLSCHRFQGTIITWAPTFLCSPEINVSHFQSHLGV